MPVMPGYIYADTPHEKTVTGAGYRYGCNSTRTGGTGAMPRGGQTKYFAHPWSYTSAEFVITDWLPKPCGHSTRTADQACNGCTNQNLPDPA